MCLRNSLLLGAVALISTTTAQKSTYCPGDNVCYAVNVPATTASSGSGDLFFQITGPSSMSWIGLGQGGSMTGANIFMIYSNAAGNNVTLSPRLGVGDKAPNVDASAQVVLLEGSGIVNNVMTANVKCSNCNSWSGGSMSFTDAKSSWIWAYKSGSAIASDSLSVSLTQHSKYGKTSLDLQSAAGGSSANPFLSSAGSTGGTATTSCVKKSKRTASPFGGYGPGNFPSSFTPGSFPTAFPGQGGNGGSGSGSGSGGSGSGSGSSSGSDSDSGSTTSDDECENTSNSGTSNSNTANGISSGSSGSSSFTQQSNMETILMAHAVLGIAAFALLFPLGAMMIRFLHFRFVLWAHAGWMITTYILAIVSMGMGIWIAVQKGYLNTSHAILGLFVVASLVLQPVTGMVHHLLFKKLGRRNVATQPHIWWGRVIVTLGIINGGLGLQLTRQEREKVIAYAVAAGVLWTLWVVVVVLALFKRRRGERDEKGVKLENRDVQRGSVGSVEEEFRHPMYEHGGPRAGQQPPEYR